MSSKILFSTKVKFNARSLGCASDSWEFGLGVAPTRLIDAVFEGIVGDDVEDYPKLKDRRALLRFNDVTAIKINSRGVVHAICESLVDALEDSFRVVERVDYSHNGGSDLTLSRSSVSGATLSQVAKRIEEATKSVGMIKQSKDGSLFPAWLDNEGAEFYVMRENPVGGDIHRMFVIKLCGDAKSPYLCIYES